MDAWLALSRVNRTIQEESFTLGIPTEDWRSAWRSDEEYVTIINDANHRHVEDKSSGLRAA
eukprot:4221175-Prorocentrum_lima.AAC.1